MKFLIVLACALAVASASGIVAPLATVYAGPQHLPVINQEGVPVDTADVQYAKAAHLSHKVNAHARNGDYAVAAVAPVVAAHSTYAAPAVAATYAAAPVVAATYAAAPAVAATYSAAPYVAAHTAYAAPIAYAHGPAAYPTTAVLPSSFNGVPLETPEVVAAKSNHFAAHAEALARSAHPVLYRHRRGIVAPVAYSSGFAAPVAYSAAYTSPVVGSYAHHVPAVSTYAAHAYPYGYAGHYY